MFQSPLQISPELRNEETRLHPNSFHLRSGKRTFSDKVKSGVSSIYESRVLRHMALAGVLTTAAYFDNWMVQKVFTYGWFYLAIIFIGSFLITVGIQYIGDVYIWHGRETLAFELSAFPRFFKNDANAIFENMGVGAMPNRASLPFCESDWDRLRGQGYTAFLSINDEWERTPRWPSFPYQERDCMEHGLRYLPVTSPDHAPLAVETMHLCADFIHEVVTEGGKVYIHCRAGKGRGPLAAAAYLIKYLHMNALQTARVIKVQRPGSTILVKRVWLEKYAVACGNVSAAGYTSLPSALAEALTQGGHLEFKK